MTKSKDQWLKAIKEKLENYSEPLPDFDWERLEHSIPLNKRRQAYKLSLYRKWQAIAAILVIMIMSGLMLWFIDTQVEFEKVYPEKIVRDITPVSGTTRKEVSPEETHSIKDVRKKEYSGMLTTSNHSFAIRQVTNSEKRDSSQPDDISLPTKTDTPQHSPAYDSIVEKQSETNAASSHNTSAKSFLYPDKKPGRKLIAPPSKQSKKKWSIALAVNDVRSIASLNNDENYMILNTPHEYGGRTNLAKNTDGTLSSSWGEKVFFANNMTYNFSPRVIRDIQHKNPLSFGLSVRKTVSGRFAVETGLFYTLLSSDIHYENHPAEKQKLHYIGVPIRVSRELLSNSLFMIYASGGGNVERCIYGRRESERLSISALQLSVAALIGVECRVGKRLGIYCEPGINYFFDDGSPIETIRKESPFNITLQAGIRLNY